MTALASFEELISIVSSLAMKGCLFLGEFPVWLAETAAGSKVGVLSLVASFYAITISQSLCLRHICLISCTV